MFAGEFSKNYIIFEQLVIEGDQELQKMISLSYDLKQNRKQRPGGETRKFAVVYR